MVCEVIPTIAVVDDHDLVREGICSSLTLIGFNVIIKATNGKDFLRQLAVTKLIPDLCLLDINMPEMNGVQTTICVKTIWPGIKILAHTFDSAEKQAMLDSGADGCILKGYGLGELKQKLLELYACKHH
jgi:DNA-binding NarL/FixJ family response regulator